MKNKGSMVVEASIVMPIVILCIFAVIYMCMFLYQQAYLQSVLDKAIEKATYVWCNPSADMDTGGISKGQLDQGGLYWRLGFLDTEREFKKCAVMDYIRARIDKFSVLPGMEALNEQDVRIELVDYLIHKKLVISLQRRYKVPFGRIFYVFGGSGSFSINMKSEAVIHEPEEFIRNTDFIADLEKELEEKYPGLKNTTEKIRESLGKIREKISAFGG